ncbi:hypothetical protein C5167_004636 [Papaver somniferum]|uniref:Uncharacterized protein n=1 Tax=Papaver somniferum TaxID=3469 RepID=A0A4Y7JB90_PAPSO|nr:cation/H(+) antiporter 28-like [Papaver somniferum]RZC57332.1 hypothetical protein C5167_004636 [Papaver somniferum]
MMMNVARYNNNNLSSMVPPPFNPRPWENLKNSTTKAGVCSYATSSSFVISTFSICLGVSLMTKSLNMMLLRFQQPRLIPELTVGIMLGNLAFMSELLEMVIPQLVSSLAEMGMSCYLLVLGLEMDLTVLTKKPNREEIVAYTGIISTFLITCAITPLIKLAKDANTIGFIFSISITLTGTSSPVLTRLITDLRISRSDIGRLVIGAGLHTDMVTMLLISLSLVFHPYKSKQSSQMKLKEGVRVVVVLVLIIVFLSTVLPIFVNWVNARNPIGKPMRGSDLVLFVATMMILCNAGPTMVGYSPTMASFLIGLAFPRKGRLSKMMITKINQILNLIMFPLFFIWVGALANFGEVKPDESFVWVKLLFLFAIVTIGKVFGALLAAMLLGFPWHVAVAIGFFLNVKGHFHIYVAAYALGEDLVTTGTYIMMVLLAMVTIALIPLVVKLMVEGARKRSPYRQMTLQHLNPSTELRILLGIHGPQNIPSMINIMEVSRGNKATRIGVYVTDMIEINDCHSTILATEVENRSLENTAMADESVVNMREQITNAILSYIEESGKGINVQRLLAISTFANMHQDLCNLAEAVQASLLILPFHRNQRPDGKMDGVHHGFRYVNRKVLRQAPCSVGVLVDRGLGKNQQRSAPTACIEVAVVFIGGKDDREALYYASRIAQHPCINLTAVRFLEETSTEKSSTKKNRKKLRSVIKMEEEERKLDDECFTEFYEKSLSQGKIGYLEKHVIDAKGTVSTLKSFEEHYALFVVGRGGRVNSILTAGMSSWEECPDLGPIGEILADSDFSLSASVLVIQQHCLDGLENEFTVMSI